LVLFSSFGAIGAELKCGVHPHQILATSSSKCELCHDKKLEQVRGNASNQPCGLCHNKKSEQAGGKASTFQLIVELFLNLNRGGARVVLITSYSNSEGEWSCCANVNYACFKENFGLCQVNANLANDCPEQQWILPFILPSSTSAKLCNDVINNVVL
jgi:hypothetical protein